MKRARVYQKTLLFWKIEIEDLLVYEDADVENEIIDWYLSMSDLEAFRIFILVHYIHTYIHTIPACMHTIETHIYSTQYTIHFLTTMSGSIDTVKLVNILFKDI